MSALLRHLTGKLLFGHGSTNPTPGMWVYVSRNDLKDSSGKI